MPAVKITTHDKIYRDLLIQVEGGEQNYAEDTDAETLPPAQKATVEAILSGRFTITVNEAGRPLFAVEGAPQ
jgi:hypothetical protein